MLHFTDATFSCNPSLNLKLPVQESQLYDLRGCPYRAITSSHGVTVLMLDVLKRHGSRQLPLPVSPSATTRLSKMFGVWPSVSSTAHCHHHHDMLSGRDTQRTWLSHSFAASGAAGNVTLLKFPRPPSIVHRYPLFSVPHICSFTLNIHRPRTPGFGTILFCSFRF